MKTQASLWTTTLVTIVAASTILAAEPPGGAGIPDVLYPRLGPAVEPVWVSRTAATGADGEFNWRSLGESARIGLEDAVSLLWARERKERGEAAAPVPPVEVMARQLPCIDVTAYGVRQPKRQPVRNSVEELLARNDHALRGQVKAVAEGFYGKNPGMLIAIADCRRVVPSAWQECPQSSYVIFLPAADFAIGDVRFCSQRDVFPLGSLRVGSELLVVFEGSALSLWAEPDGILPVSLLWLADESGTLAHPRGALGVERLRAASTLDEVEMILLETIEEKRGSLRLSGGGAR